MNVLVAEDDAVTRLTLAAALRGMGHDVTEAEHGGEAWATLALAHFPVVISDWQMPEVDGPELCRRIRARAGARYTYFLLVTATGGSAAISKAWKPGRTTSS